MSAVVIPPANPPRSHGWSGYPLLWLQVSFLRLVASAPAKNDKLPEDIDVVHSTIPSRDSGREIKVSIYRARGITPSGKILLNWHGSGAVMHFFGEDKTYCAWMAGQLKDDGVTVYDLDYRKAPENPFPAGIEDVEDGILHFASLPTTTHIAVGGFSAGAKFAVSAAVSTKPVLESRQSKAKVNAVIAFYPSIDVRPGANRKPPSSTKRSGVLFPLWVFGAFSRAFCVDPASAYDKRASPVLSEASEFPPHMLLICGDADAFHDDCKNFVDKLNATTPAHPDAKFLRTFPAAAIEPTGAVDLFRLLRPDENGLASSAAAKLAALSDFYSSLFSARPTPTLAMNSPLLSNIRLRLDAFTSAALNAPFSLMEVYRALRSANRHSSAGPDGITYRVYLATFAAAGPLLIALANFLGNGHPHVWPVAARTILLPKAGDLSDIANYRPISITDAHVRIISRLVSGRLMLAGDKLLPWTQAAFLPGRRSSLVAGVLHGLTDLLSLPPSSLTPPAFFVISLDQRKAYDRVLRAWLFAVLQTANIPPMLLGVLTAVYSQPTTRISALGALGPIIDLLCGVLQGDPASCFLYNLSLQPLFDLLLAFNIGVHIPHLGLLSALAFADDCLLFIEASPKGLSQLTTLFSCLGSYSAAAGAALNLGKSSFWLLGTPTDSNLDAADRIAAALSAYGLTPAGSSGPSSHLGHPLPPADVSSPHAHTLLFSRLASIKVRATCFRTMGVDVLSRVANSNKYLGARLWHTVAIGPLPANFSALFHDSLHSYLQAALVVVTFLFPSRLYGLLDPILA
ncbi:hypothetical protein CF336_g357 [Tilletia laevis]|nr:hypothetical protein CF336_g357 [Tilletia laevis]